MIYIGIYDIYEYILGGNANVMFYFCSHTKEPVRGEGSFTQIYDVLEHSQTVDLKYHCEVTHSIAQPLASKAKQQLLQSKRPPQSTWKESYLPKAHPFSVDDMFFQEVLVCGMNDC